ncbi:autophagy-related protein 4 [Clonorchis sinensis]|uniref:Cysteine protease n=1 Tax=Clonorchis sinensis TaxID=79923 RepID=G7Y301_CLOSI|nr:autophagy-related protein 4 [Clonorchis sinensis]
MMLAEAITRIHLGKDWRWTPGCQDEAYCRLRRMFQDHKSSLYSIQNITMLGMALDKPIGSWFGPNTVAQVIKKLCAYDPCTNWYVHISVEDGVIVDEIISASPMCEVKRFFIFICRTRRRPTNSELTSVSFEASDTKTPDSGNWVTQVFEIISGCRPTERTFNLASGHVVREHSWVRVVSFASHLPVFKNQMANPVTRILDEDFLEIVLPPTYDSEHDSDHPPITPPVVPAPRSSLERSPPPDNDRLQASEIEATPSPATWRPLLLFIPLRLGLHQPNPCYFNAIKAILQIPHSIGIMGGRPSHAVWIVGTAGDEDLLCLDPHTTQPASQDDLTAEDDVTHHCDCPVRLPLERLDPSMVIGFVCTTEDEFDQLCAHLERDVLSVETTCGHPLFEVHKSRPSNLPPLPVLLFNSRSERASDTSVKEETDEGDTSNPPSPTASDPSKIGGAMNAVRALWSKCNQVAEETVRSLTNLGGPMANSVLIRVDLNNTGRWPSYGCNMLLGFPKLLNIWCIRPRRGKRFLCTFTSGPQNTRIQVHLDLSGAEDVQYEEPPQHPPSDISSVTESNALVKSSSTNLWIVCTYGADLTIDVASTWSKYRLMLPGQGFAFHTKTKSTEVRLTTKLEKADRLLEQYVRERTVQSTPDLRGTPSRIECMAQWLERESTDRKTGFDRSTKPQSKLSNQQSTSSSHPRKMSETFI